MIHDVDVYAMKILADAGCDCYTYGGEEAKNIMKDLKKTFPDGMEYPYIDVANAILAFSRPEPIKRSPWKMHWETDSTADATDHDFYETAKNDAIETLIEWEMELIHEWKDGKPTEKQIEDWNYMIYNCFTSVKKYNPETDEYDEEWSPSNKELKEILWVPYEELKKTKQELKEKIKKNKKGENNG